MYCTLYCTLTAFTVFFKHVLRFFQQRQGMRQDYRQVLHQSAVSWGWFIGLSGSAAWQRSPVPAAHCRMTVNSLLPHSGKECLNLFVIICSSPIKTACEKQMLKMNTLKWELAEVQYRSIFASANHSVVSLMVRATTLSDWLHITYNCLSALNTVNRKSTE